MKLPFVEAVWLSADVVIVHLRCAACLVTAMVPMMVLLARIGLHRGDKQVALQFQSALSLRIALAALQYLSALGVRARTGAS